METTIEYIYIIMVVEGRQMHQLEYGRSKLWTAYRPQAFLIILQLLALPTMVRLQSTKF